MSNHEISGNPIGEHVAEAQFKEMVKTGEDADEQLERGLITPEVAELRRGMLRFLLALKEDERKKEEQVARNFRLAFNADWKEGMIQQTEECRKNPPLMLIRE